MIFKLKKLFYKYSLLCVVFVTGAAVLVIEVAAVRILAPYFGNTIFSVSSIMGVVLAALSLGYYVGGKLSDARPSLKLFFSLIALGGLSVIFLRLLQTTLLPFLGYYLSLVSGALIASIVLFFLPSFFLGMISPFAVTLQKKREEGSGVGTVSGEVFAWSTMGSITGSLLTGFFLIPNFGVDEIILGTGMVLVFLGSLPGLIRFKSSRSLIFIALALVFVFNVPVAESENVIYEDDGIYRKVVVKDVMHEKKQARFLVQDKSRSGGIFKKGGDIAADYMRYYKVYELFKPDADRFAVLGGGAYIIPDRIVESIPDATVDVSEIEPQLIDVAHKYFGVDESPRLRNHLVDARRFLRNRDKSYDVMIGDVYTSIYSQPSHLVTREFFKLARKSLSEGGIFIANVVGDLIDQYPSFALSEVKTFRSVFPNSYFFAVNSPTSTKPQNIIFVGQEGGEEINFSATSTEDVIEVEGRKIDLSKQLINVKRFDMSQHPIFTDNYAPVDYFVAQTIERLTERN